MELYVRNGTPLDGPSLCETCSQAFIKRGYRQSEEIVLCQVTSPEHAVRFRVRDCSRYTDKTKQTIWEMEKIAWTLAPRAGKRAGFPSPAEVVQDEPVIEFILDHKSNR